MIVRILKMMIVQNFKSSKTISLIHCSLKSFHIRLDCFVFWCWCFVAFELSNAMSLLSNVLKTIKSFCRMISKRSNSLKSNFWNFSSDWDFYFVLISCTRKRHSAMIESTIENVMMIDENDQRMWWFWFSLSKRKSFRSCRFHNSSFTIFVACSHLSLSSVLVEL
jgi:hypothetical protein